MSHPVSSLNYGSLVTYQTWTNAMQVRTSRNSFVFLICYKVRPLWRAQQELHIPIDFPNPRTAPYYWRKSNQ